VKSAIAILTFRRLGALQTTLDGIFKHVPEDVPVAVFEDCANFDDTVGFLTERATALGCDDELEAAVYRWSADRAGTREVTVFIGQRNVGVAGNSNKAIRWFERQEGYDHLLLCNDDLIVTGDFAAVYGQAHEALKIGLFCFCPVKLGEEYVGPVVKVLGHQVRMVPRMTGSMMSMTLALVKKIGYFDVSFGRFGEEHSDFTNRSRFAGFIVLRGKTQHCLDIITPTLDYNYGMHSSVAAQEKKLFDKYAAQAMERVAPLYQTLSWYRPFRLLHASNAGAYGGVGIPVRMLEECGYTLVVDHDLKDALTATI
jgi:hypothetical protein